MLTPLDYVLLMLGVAVLGVIAFRIMQLPPMLGYLTAGILIGPHSIGLVQDSEMIQSLANFGVVFLMFSIGLEFSMTQLSAMRRWVFGLGMLQVSISIVVVMVACILYVWLSPTGNISWQAALALGGALSMSSTAIVSKMLAERMELETEHGRRIIGILLFQDLAVVLLLIVVPTLARGTGNLWLIIGLAFLKALVVLIVLLFLGQRLMNSWMGLVAKRRSKELFVLNVLLITLGMAWITEHAGLSMELGAFIAGMLISETRFRHEVELDIKSFRDVLLGLFFITIGMRLDILVVLQNWWLVLLLLIIPFMFKFVLIGGLTRFFGASKGVSIRTGLALAQAGEFGFVLLSQLDGLHMIDRGLVQVILASMVLSMFVAPFAITHADKIVLKLSANEWMLQSVALTQLASYSMSMQQHVIIVGFGRTGQAVAGMLESEGIAYRALDLDVERIRQAEAAGAHVSYADATRRESLVAAGIHRASSLVISFTDTASALRIIHYAKELVPELPIIVRSEDDVDMDRLKDAGADEVVPEALESSLVLSSHACLIAGIPLRRVMRKAQVARMERYITMRDYFRGGSDQQVSEAFLNNRLHSVRMQSDLAAIGKTLKDLNLYDGEVTVTLVRRGTEKLHPEPEMQVQDGDVLVLRGSAESLAEAEEQLLK